MWLLSLLWGCGSDHFLSHGKIQNEIEYVYVQDNYIEGSDDTGLNEPIWVDSFTQPSISNGVDIIWVIDGSGSMTDDHALVLQGISDMMHSLPLISWRLVIISMTPHEAVAVEEAPLGMLIPFYAVAISLVILGIFSGDLVTKIIHFAIPAGIV